MVLDFKQLDEIEFNNLVNSALRANKIVKNIKLVYANEFSNWNIEHYVYLANNERIMERDIAISDVDFEFDLNKIVKLARKLKEEELDFNGYNQ